MSVSKQCLLNETTGDGFTIPIILNTVDGKLAGNEQEISMEASRLAYYISLDSLLSIFFDDELLKYPLRYDLFFTISVKVCCN